MLRLVVFSLFLLCCMTENVVPPHGTGLESNNVLEYPVESTNTNQQFICSDNNLGLYCGFFYSYVIQCWSFHSEKVYETKTEGLTMAVYDEKTNHLIYASGLTTDFTIHGYNLQTQEEVFSIPTDIDQDGGDWYVNSNLGSFYTQELDSFKNKLRRRDSTTGAIISTPSSQFYSAESYFNCYVVDNYNKLACGPQNSADICDNAQTYEIVLLDAETLEQQCSITRSMNRYSGAFYSNTRYIYIYDDTSSCNHTGTDISGYNLSCEQLWRVPVDFEIVTFSYDLQNQAIYMYSGNMIHKAAENDFSSMESAEIFEFDESAAYNFYNVFQPYYVFVGVDDASNLNFWGQTSETEFSFIQFDSGLKQTKVSYSAPGSLMASIYQSFLTVTNQGIMFQYSSAPPNDLPEGHIMNVMSAADGYWSLADTLSTLLLVLSFIIAIVLSIKHCALGEDPEGWNKRKLFDVLCTVITTFGLILVTVIISIAQMEISSTITDNTEMFDSKLEGFADAYVAHCTSATATATDIGLCTCTDPEEEFQASSCIGSSCLNSPGMSCADYLMETCDCYDSLYQWNCESCEYLNDNTCTANATSTTTVNPVASKQWEKCQKHFAKPTKLLNANFYLLIISTCIIVALQLVNIALKLDNTICDLFTSVLSVIFALVQFIIIIVGFSYASQASSDCISEVMSDLPGCVLTSPTVLTMESDAAAALKNAYGNLYTAPIMFILSTLPDIWPLLHTTATKFFRKDYQSI